jgi:chromosome segregation ATPase
MKFPATDIEFAMQEEIDRLKARIAELEKEVEHWQAATNLNHHHLTEAEARIAELEGARDKLLSGEDNEILASALARIAELETHIKVQDGALREIEEKADSISWEGEIARAALKELGIG